MAALNPSVVCVALRTLQNAGTRHLEQIGQAKIATPRSTLVVETGLESGENRSAVLHVRLELAALRVAEQSNVGQQKHDIFFQGIRVEIVLMYEVERIPGLEQCVIQALQKFGRVAAAGWLVEGITALGKHHADICQRATVDEMAFVFGNPIEEAPPGVAPAQIVWRTAQPVVPRDHSAGGGLGHPHGGLFGCFRGVPPKRVGVGVSAGYVRDCAPLHHAVRHPALLCAVPNGSAAATALVISVKPSGDAGNLFQICRSVNAATQVSNVNTVPFLLPGCGVPEFPDLEHSG